MKKQPKELTTEDQLSMALQVIYELTVGRKPITSEPTSPTPGDGRVIEFGRRTA